MSRKRRKRRPRTGAPAGPPKSRAAVEPAPRRAARGERPTAPWGSFPLTELTVFVGLVMLAGGFLIGGFRGTMMIGVGTTLASLGGLEISIREHFAGYRSHTALLALACAVLTAAVTAALFYALTDSVLLLIPILVGAVVFAAALLALRGAFRRASGGLSYRIGSLRG